MRFLRFSVVVVLVAVCGGALAAEPGKELRAGIIGLDTSHCGAFAKVLNDPKATDDVAGVRIVAAFPNGTEDNPSSWDRVGKYTEDFRKMNIEICPTVDDLLKKVDVVLLECVDGRPHLKYARACILAKKPLFIDKPMAASLADVIEIFRLSKQYQVPCFSSSSLRYSTAFQEIRNKTSPFGEVKSCLAWSPMSLEPHHPDLFWYGIHGMEILYTIMGPGCKTVVREGPEKVVGTWADGRKGTFASFKAAEKKGYGATVEGTKQSGDTGKYDGYRPLVVQIVKFFKTGVAPIDPAETTELFAFMEAADESKRQNGAPVSIESVIAKARQAQPAK